MKVVILNFLTLTDMKVVHQIFRETLNFPSSYGNNLDALYDMLTTRHEPVVIEVKLGGDSSWNQLLKMLYDAARENQRIDLRVRE